MENPPAGNVANPLAAAAAGNNVANPPAAAAAGAANNVANPHPPAAAAAAAAANNVLDHLAAAEAAAANNVANFLAQQAAAAAAAADAAAAAAAAAQARRRQEDKDCACLCCVYILGILLFFTVMILLDDVRYILQIPLREGVPDFVAWQYDSKGSHSVKSAYKLQVKLGKLLKQGGVGSSTATATISQRADDSWTRLWKLRGPRNIQMFTWRLKHESLAFRLNLKKRGVPVEDTKCLFCGRADEDGGHLFIKCKFTKAAWRELELEPERRDLEGELPESAEEVARRTRANVMQYEQIYSLPKAGQAPQRWRPPPDDMIKINTDGSFVPGQEGSGWGVIARDAAGEVIAARAGRQDHVQDAFALEVYALAHAISLAADLGLVRVTFETDSSLLLEAMDLARVDASAYAAVIEDLKFQLKIWFSKHKITLCRR
ncbi:retrotransposon unclassified [Hordeum vulgare]|nr:retrotransposon unclassified [Hordeum vulgare]